MVSMDEVMSSTRETMNLGATCCEWPRCQYERGMRERERNAQQAPHDQSNTDIDRVYHNIFEQ